MHDLVRQLEDSSDEPDLVPESPLPVSPRVSPLDPDPESPLDVLSPEPELIVPVSIVPIELVVPGIVRLGGIGLLLVLLPELVLLLEPDDLLPPLRRLELDDRLELDPLEALRRPVEDDTLLSDPGLNRANPANGLSPSLPPDLLRRVCVAPAVDEPALLLVDCD